eukprot:g2704.t1
MKELSKVQQGQSSSVDAFLLRLLHTPRDLQAVLFDVRLPTAELPDSLRFLREQEPGPGEGDVADTTKWGLNNVLRAVVDFHEFQQQRQKELVTVSAGFLCSTLSDCYYGGMSLSFVLISLEAYLTERRLRDIRAGLDAGLVSFLAKLEREDCWQKRKWVAVLATRSTSPFAALPLELCGNIASFL